MPLVLPTGSAQVRVVPQAPNWGDPRLYVGDPERNAQALATGLVFSQKMLDLQNLQKQRELDSMKIDAAKAQNKLDLALTQNALETLPQVFQHVKTVLDTQALTDQGARAAASTAPEVGALAGQTALTGAQVAGTQAATALSQAKAAQAATGDMTPFELEAAKANAAARGGAYGQLGLSVPGAAPAPVATLSAPPAAAPSPGPVLANVDYLGRPIAAPAAPASAPADTNPDATPGTPAALKHWAATGQPVRGSTGNVILDAVRARAAIPTDLAQSAKMQDEARTLLQKYAVPSDARAKLMDGENHYDIGRVYNYFDSIKDLTPKLTYGDIKGFPEAYDKATLIRQMQDFTTSQLPTMLKSLGDPSSLQKVLEGMRDSDPAKGYLQRVLATAAASKTKPETAARAAVVDFLNARVQQIFNTQQEGRALKNNLVLSSKDSNETILKTASVLNGLLGQEYEITKKGFPPTAFSTLDSSNGGPVTPGQVAGEFSSAADKLGGNPFAPPAKAQPKVGDISIINGHRYQLVERNGQLGWALQQ